MFIESPGALKQESFPTREECINLMIKENMPPHIREHSFTVCSVAIKLTELFLKQGFNISPQIVEAGALLHDIAKGKCIEEKCHHALVGAEIVKSYGYHEYLAKIVEDHVNITQEDINQPVKESIIVNYADKRVLHTKVVSLDQRFADLIERYGLTPKSEAFLRTRWDLYKQLECALSYILKSNISGNEFINFRED